MDDEKQKFIKSPDAFRTISEASDEVGVPPHVLRFWEGKFSNLRPLKRAGGRRFYRAQDMALLRGLKALLQDDGYTIRGVQKLIKESGIQAIRNRSVAIDSSQSFSFDSIENDEVEIDVNLQNSTSSDNVQKSNQNAGLALRQAIIRLEQTRMMLDKVLQN